MYIKTGCIILFNVSPSNFDSLVNGWSHLLGVTRLLRNGKRRSEGAEALACIRRIYPNEERSGGREENEKGWGWWRARTTLNTSYSRRVDEPLQRGRAKPRVRVRTCESRGMKIYHTVFITVDAIVGSNHVWDARSIFRAAAIYAPAERSKSRVADDQRRVLRSTAAPVASRRRRDGDEGLLMSAELAVFISSNCEIQTFYYTRYYIFPCAHFIYVYHNLRSFRCSVRYTSNHIPKERCISIRTKY